jgi:hypothetical protein
MDQPGFLSDEILELFIREDPCKSVAQFFLC